MQIDQFFEEAEEARERALGLAKKPMSEEEIIRMVRDEPQQRKCEWPGCGRDISDLHGNRKVCDEHWEVRKREKAKGKKREAPSDYKPPIKAESTLQDAYEAIQAELEEIMAAKQHDYGSDNITALGVRGVFVRMWDKINRLKTLVWMGAKPQVEETVDDTLLDIANYAIIALLVRRGEWGKDW